VKSWTDAGTAAGGRAVLSAAEAGAAVVSTANANAIISAIACRDRRPQAPRMPPH
jgi:hypothetical protein